MKQDEPFHISVNGQHEFDLQPSSAKDLDLVVDGAGQFHILHEGKSYHATLIAADHSTRQFTVRVNGSSFTVDIADRYDRLVQQLGLKIGSNQKTNIVKAPMPGLVLQILAEPGQEISKGDPLLILEAMKMENIIKAVGDGRVKGILVGQGAAVEKGQVLLELE